MKIVRSPSLQKVQEGRISFIQKEGREILVAMVLDCPLERALVRDPDAFLDAPIQTIPDKVDHPVIMHMLHPDVRDDLPASACASTSSWRGDQPLLRLIQNPMQPKEQ